MARETEVGFAKILDSHLDPENLLNMVVKHIVN